MATEIAAEPVQHYQEPQNDVKLFNKWSFDDVQVLPPLLFSFSICFDAESYEFNPLWFVD